MHRCKTLQEEAYCGIECAKAANKRPSLACSRFAWNITQVQKRRPQHAHVCGDRNDDARNQACENSPH
jgi:hypothetical protein